MYDQYSRAVSNQERVIVAQVWQSGISIGFGFFSGPYVLIKGPLCLLVLESLPLVRTFSSFLFILVFQALLVFKALCFFLSNFPCPTSIPDSRVPLVLKNIFIKSCIVSLLEPANSSLIACLNRKPNQRLIDVSLSFHVWFF